MEQVIRVNMKMGIVGNRVQAWLADGGTPEQVEKLGQDVGTYLDSFQLTQAEASMDSLFSIVVGATASSESASTAGACRDSTGSWNGTPRSTGRTGGRTTSTSRRRT